MTSIFMVIELIEAVSSSEMLEHVTNTRSRTLQEMVIWSATTAKTPSKDSKYFEG